MTTDVCNMQRVCQDGGQAPAVEGTVDKNLVTGDRMLGDTASFSKVKHWATLHCEPLGSAQSRKASPRPQGLRLPSDCEVEALLVNTTVVSQHMSLGQAPDRVASDGEQVGRPQASPRGDTKLVPSDVATHWLCDSSEVVENGSIIDFLNDAVLCVVSPVSQSRKSDKFSLVQQVVSQPVGEALDDLSSSESPSFPTITEETSQIVNDALANVVQTDQETL